MTDAQWYARPEGEGITLRQAPRLASWNRADDPEQIRLQAYLRDTADLLAPFLLRGPFALRLDVGLPEGRDLLDSADLDNYVLPLAARLRSEHLVSVWCTKQHAHNSRVVIAGAQRVEAPRDTIRVHTTASAESKAYKEQIHAGVRHATEVRPGPVLLQVAFVVGPRRNWLNLWKPTIDALDPLLGRTRASREWHPKDGRIVDLGLHIQLDSSLGHDVLVNIAAGPT